MERWPKGALSRARNSCQCKSAARDSGSQGCLFVCLFVFTFLFLKVGTSSWLDCICESNSFSEQASSFFVFPTHCAPHSHGSTSSRDCGTGRRGHWLDSLRGAHLWCHSSPATPESTLRCKWEWHYCRDNLESTFIFQAKLARTWGFC